MLKIIFSFPFQYVWATYTVAQKNGTVDFLGLCSDQQLSFFTLLDRASFPHYNMDHQHLQLREHIKKVCSSSMSALNRIAQIRDCMSTKTTEKLIHACVTSRIDSCNAPVTPMLTRLHWLPVDKKIVYKIVLLCHKVLIHKSPTYLASVLTP